MMMKPSRALPIAFLLAACGSEPSGDAARGSAADSASAAPATAADTTAAAPAGSAAPTIVLAPDGLSVTGAAPKQLAFGSPRAGALAAVGEVLGEPAEQGLQEECPAGPLYQAQYGGGLQLVFQDSAFVGWNVRPGSAFRTREGVGAGSTLAQLRAAYPATKVEETSLGMEFAADDLFGVVTDSSAAGTVEAMFAGINCIFR
ncbi:MAG TPA: hypothetical protein VK358_11835 [Longimicrobium sp.]|nr:hypothetical protein [Longimicrobium sp.]